MKILQLNVWMGKIEGALQRYLQNNKFDVICMQEVFASDDCVDHLRYLCFDRSRILEASGMPYSFYTPHWRSKLADGHFMMGNLILSRIPIVEEYSEFTSGEFRDDMILGKIPGNNLSIQKVKLENGLTVFNHHGYWHSHPIGNENTVEAFRKVGEIVKHTDGPVVLCGDFNIIHESPAMRSLDFLRDLTDEHQIKTTLSGIKVNLDVPCDHIMVNDEIEVKQFGIVEDLISDHLGLQAEIALK